MATFGPSEPRTRNLLLQSSRTWGTSLICAQPTSCAARAAGTTPSSHPVWSFGQASAAPRG